MGKEFVPVERIARAILVIRGEKVMLDSDLAALYNVTTGNLNKAVKRNAEVIRQLMAVPATLRREIGFHVREKAPRYRVV